jgi:hypothetical protein
VNSTLKTLLPSGTRNTTIYVFEICRRLKITVRATVPSIVRNTFEALSASFRRCFHELSASKVAPPQICPPQVAFREILVGLIAGRPGAGRKFDDSTDWKNQQTRQYRTEFNPLLDQLVTRHCRNAASEKFGKTNVLSNRILSIQATHVLRPLQVGFQADKSG